ncbi:protein FAR1-RELATED SEQUENCE 6-like isoform X1 [Salvia splendens]|nr:protein FAR1-RELATED SEQUENCE 6-like isoform X1 [Salvia splendens]XP_042064025.1 protein FAR1-RELATED SEQUENCE 6-like isoform X1 [Salvia splendens]XP_042064026.1 protein FAR1-RELATED SEQUENCE 6-like isoform X1 [Salvia splendens]
MDDVSLNSEPTYNEEFEIDGEFAMTEYVGQTGEVLQGDDPAVGMEFESYDDVYFFYNCYAKQQGFGVRVSNTWYRKSKERYRGKLSCSSAGFKKKTDANRPRPETRTGCPAMIKFRLMDNKRWRIIEIELEHNHLTTPANASIYKSHKISDLGSKRPLPINGADQVQRIRLFRTVVIDADDTEECDFRDTIDQGDDKLKLKPGDYQEMLKFFTRMQLNDPSFFYSMDVNEKGCLRNVFWAEARCRAAYSYFGDVLFVNTTSLTENYEVPLVVFTGINHHAQTVPLGCGLVSVQTVESFVWLYRAWLTYMVGRSPQTIITSECKALQTAVAEVFPRASHCLSLTNIMKMVLHEVACLEACEAIRNGLSRAVYHSLRSDEFEAAWEDLVQSHGLQNHKWLQNLYEDRKRWVPVYLKEIFCAGMFPVDSPFQEYLRQHTSLREFFSSYDRSQQDIHHRETLSDIESNNKSRSLLKTRLFFELQLSKLYTENIFELFQQEVEGVYSCYGTRQKSIEGSVATFIVKEDVQVEENRKETRDFEVMYNSGDAVEVLCVCAVFNLRGYLCRHALCVINHVGLDEIPPQYILARWRKDINRSYTIDYRLDGIDIKNPVHRYDNLYRSVTKVVEEGRKSHDRYRFVAQWLMNKVVIQDDQQS